jgi:peptidylprolyl isomerase
MAIAAPGKTVSVYYTLRLSDGTVYGASRNYKPLTFTVGQGEVIPGLEEAVQGMEPGSTRRVSIPHEKAYGNWDRQLLFEVPRTRFHQSINPRIGQRLEARMHGKAFPVQVVRASDDHMVVDANHPLAGKDLLVDLVLMSIT